MYEPRKVSKYLVKDPVPLNAIRIRARSSALRVPRNVCSGRVLFLEKPLCGEGVESIRENVRKFYIHIF